MIRRPIQPPPNTPGVYIFRKSKIPVYIGKAANLKKRIAAYFRKYASGKIRQLVEEATKLEWIETESEAEALIKEAELIKQYHPKFNYLMRDDKSYFYVALTKDLFPRILVVHKTALAKKKWRRAIGPFTSGSALRLTLKLLRRIFPYCTCKELHRRRCLNAQIGRCLGFCCGKSQAPNSQLQAQNNEYNKNIKNIIAILSGKRTRLLSQLKREMGAASRAQEYERAATLRDQIAGLKDIFSHARLINHYRGEASIVMRRKRVAEIIRELVGAKAKISRVEGYDISNISGTAATGSMVVFVDGRPAKTEYRKFKIKTVHQISDVDMLKEVIRRRLRHPEWPYPQLMLIDGGKPQLNAVLTAITNNQLPVTIHVAALAKREEELYIKGKPAPVRLDSLPPEVMHFFQYVRDESHRFAQKYHHKLREISYREQAPKT